MVVWHQRVYRKCYKAVFKGLKLELGSLQKLESKAPDSFENHTEEDEERGDREIKKKMQEASALIAAVRDDLTDLSLSYASVGALDHSHFVMADSSLELDHPSPAEANPFNLSIDKQVTSDLRDDRQKPHTYELILNNPIMAYKIALVEHCVAFVSKLIEGQRGSWQRLQAAILDGLGKLKQARLFQPSQWIYGSVLAELCLVAMRPL